MSGNLFDPRRKLDLLLSLELDSFHVINSYSPSNQVFSQNI